MKSKVNAVAVQMDIKGLDMEANLTHMCELIDKVAAEGSVDLIVFPELANSGYVKIGDPTFSKEYIRHGEKVPGTFTEGLGEKAKRYGVYVVTGMLEAHPQVPYTLYNSAVLIGPTGEVLGVHRKVHMPLAERNFFYSGSKIQVFTTELGNIAIQVCADGTIPELSRIFSLKGAEIICTPYNMLNKPGRFFNERLYYIAGCRAIENMNFYIACNRVGSDASGTFLGHSCIAKPLGHLLASSNSDKEEILRATLEEEMLLEARGNSPYFGYRRPELYTPLVEPY